MFNFKKKTKLVKVEPLTEEQQQQIKGGKNGNPPDWDLQGNPPDWDIQGNPPDWDLHGNPPDWDLQGNPPQRD